MAESAVVSKYIDDLGSEEPFIRRVAARALGELRDPAARVALAGLLVDPDASVRLEVVKAFGATMDEENSGAVLAALKNDPDSSVRAAAASVLGTLRTQTAVDALSDALKDPAWNVRGAAALSLGQVGGEKGISTLSRALNDVYEAFADFAGDALKKKQGTASAETPTEDTDAEHTGGDDAPASG